jgi:predicted HTH transcriptional regulator
MLLTQDDLLRLLHSTEHSFVERKTFGDTKDVVKSVVAFANTLSTNQEGILFVGATDKGEIQPTPTNLDKLQTTLSSKIGDIYPPVYYTTRTVIENNRECLALVVPGSAAKPHFSGPPFLRDGSKTVVVSSGQYEALLASRIDKTRELQQWIARQVTLDTFRRSGGMGNSIHKHTVDGLVVGCNQFFLTVKYNNAVWSFPLSRVVLSYDHQHDRLTIEYTYPETGG